MQIHFFATLRQIVGGKTVELATEDGLTVRALIGALVTRWPPLGSQLLDEHGQLYGHVHVLINGRDAPYLPAGLETVVTAHDTVNIFPAVAGGAE